MLLRKEFWVFYAKMLRNFISCSSCHAECKNLLSLGSSLGSSPQVTIRLCISNRCTQHKRLFKWLRLEDVDVKTGLSLPVGQGSLDWKEILSAAQAHGCEWLIIQDHDQAKFNRDIYQSVDCSMAYLREMYKTLGWKWEISQAE